MLISAYINSGRKAGKFWTTVCGTGLFATGRRRATSFSLFVVESCWKTVSSGRRPFLWPRPIWSSLLPDLPEYLFFGQIKRRKPWTLEKNPAPDSHPSWAGIPLYRSFHFRSLVSSSIYLQGGPTEWNDCFLYILLLLSFVSFRRHSLNYWNFSANRLAVKLPNL